MSKKIVNYIIYFEENVRKRHYHITEKGTVSDFAVQLEMKVRDEWKVVIRYDCSHGFSHKDEFDIRGDKKKKMLDLSFNNALTLSDWDINENWPKYTEGFLKE